MTPAQILAILERDRAARERALRAACAEHSPARRFPVPPKPAKKEK